MSGRPWRKRRNLTPRRKAKQYRSFTFRGGQYGTIRLKVMRRSQQLALLAGKAKGLVTFGVHGINRFEVCGVSDDDLTAPIDLFSPANWPTVTFE